MVNLVRRLHVVAAASLFLVTATGAVGGSGSARADRQICEQYGSTWIEGSYVVQNDRWGSSTETQCINVTDTGFVITQQGSNPTSGSPLSYPSIYLGCYYNNCSPGSTLPMQLSAVSSVTSSIGYSYVDGGNYDAAYDIWLDPTPRKDGQNQMELMIWFNRQGGIHPVGSPVDKTAIGGRQWEVWQGPYADHSHYVISYVATSPMNAWTFNVLDFTNDMRGRGLITNDWYLTSVQAGFECYYGGVGLAVNSFSVAINH